MSAGPSVLNVEVAVNDRYSGAAKTLEASLCCPTHYDPRLLDVIPAEVVERDYGCGDPSAYLRHGDTVLDLGSGSGKICFIASQIVGPEGRVIGVDMNDEMLALAKRSAPEVTRSIGYANVAFKKGRIQDLALDVEALDHYLRAHPVGSAADLQRLEAEMARLRTEAPLIAGESVDVVVSNCVLNLVDSNWRTVDGIEFRSVTVVAYKGKDGPCLDQKHAVIYRGPFREVVDDDGHVIHRGVRTVVCEKTFRIFSGAPYSAHVELVSPRVLVPLEAAPPFPCSKGALRRSPRETKGEGYGVTTDVAMSVCRTGNGETGSCC